MVESLSFFLNFIDSFRLSNYINTILYLLKQKKMQKLSLLLALLLFTVCGFSQSMTEEKDVTMSLGTHNAFVLDLSEISAKKTESYWADYFRDISKLKKNRKAGEYYAEGVRIPLISSNELDVYSKVEDLKGNSRLYVWIDHDGAFLNSADEAKAGKNALDFMNNFALQAEKRSVEEMLEAEEKALKGLEKDLKSLGKEKDKYQKSIEDAKAAIIKNEENIEKNLLDTESKDLEIEKQRSLIESVRDRLKEIGKKEKTRM